MSTENIKAKVEEDDKYEGPGVLIYFLMCFFVILLLAKYEGWLADGWLYYNAKLLNYQNTGLESSIGRTAVKFWCRILIWLGSFKVAQILIFLINTVFMYVCLLGIGKLKMAWLRIPLIVIMVILVLFFLVSLLAFSRLDMTELLKYAN